MYKKPNHSGLTKLGDCFSCNKEVIIKKCSTRSAAQGNSLFLPSLSTSFPSVWSKVSVPSPASSPRLQAEGRLVVGAGWWRLEEKNGTCQLSDPFYRKIIVFPKFLANRHLLTFHWPEVGHMPPIAARKSGEISFFNCEHGYLNKLGFSE